MMPEHANEIRILADESPQEMTKLALEAEIQSQKTTIGSLRALIGQYQAEVDAHQREPIGFRALSVAKKENSEGVGNFQLADAERKVRVSDSKISKLASEIHRLEGDKRVMESTISSLKTRIRAANTERDGVYSQIKEMQAEKQVRQDELTSLSRMVGNLKEALSASKSRVVSLEARSLNMIEKQEHERMMSELTDRLEEYISGGLEASENRVRLENEMRGLQTTNSHSLWKISELNTLILNKDCEIRSLIDESTARTNQIVKLESDLRFMVQSHEQEKESRDSSHSIAIALLEQSTSAALSKASVANNAIEVMKQKINDLLIRNEKLEKERFDEIISNKRSTMSVGVGTVQLQQHFTSVQTEEECHCTGITTDPVTILFPEQVRRIHEISTCGLCGQRLHITFSIFPCGHGCCTKCCEEALVRDEMSLCGITCAACENPNLPVTRIVRNRPLEEIINLIVSPDWSR